MECFFSVSLVLNNYLSKRRPLTYGKRLHEKHSLLFALLWKGLGKLFAVLKKYCNSLLFELAKGNNKYVIKGTVQRDGSGRN